VEDVGGAVVVLGDEGSWLGSTSRGATVAGEGRKDAVAEMAEAGVVNGGMAERLNDDMGVELGWVVELRGVAAGWSCGCGLGREG
jgi:hypothetical protein